MSRPKILITPRSLTRDGHASLARLQAAGYAVVTSTAGQQPTEKELLKLLPDCIGYLAGVEPISERVLESATRLKVISRNGTGVDNLDLGAAARLGITVLRAEGANARGVAELTIGLIFALVRGIPFSDGELKRANWDRRKGMEVAGRSLGLIGCGRIGQKVASMAIGLGMDVWVYDPFADDPFPTGARRSDSLFNLLSNVDVISLHCPAQDDQPVINSETLALMKHGSYIVNTARGELIDDLATLEALNTGQLAGLAIDAYRREPPGDDPLVRHDKVIATPHIGAYTDESVARACEAAVDNLLEFLGPANKHKETSI